MTEGGFSQVPLGNDGLSDVLGAAVLFHHQLSDLLEGCRVKGQLLHRRKRRQSKRMILSL